MEQWNRPWKYRKRIKRPLKILDAIEFWTRKISDVFYFGKSFVPRRQTVFGDNILTDIFCVGYGLMKPKVCQCSQKIVDDSLDGCKGLSHVCTTDKHRSRTLNTCIHLRSRWIDCDIHNCDRVQKLILHTLHNSFRKQH